MLQTTYTIEELPSVLDVQSSVYKSIEVTNNNLQVIELNKTIFESEGIKLDLVDKNGELWFRGNQIERILGYKATHGSSINRVYIRHKDEFTAKMTTVMDLPVSGGVRQVRIFSFRGCHFLGAFARTDKARIFRAWTLDIFEKHIGTLSLNI